MDEFSEQILRTAAAAPPAAAAPTPANRHAAEWGLASLLLAGFSAVVAVLTVLFGTLYDAHLNQIGPRGAGLMATIVFSVLITLMFWALSVASVLFGLVALRSSGRDGQPAGLPLAGLLLSAVVLLLWTAVAVGVAMEAADLTRRL
jgi:hypothetical protein